MQRTQRQISLKQEILSKLSLNEMEGNPICPLDKRLGQKTGKLFKKVQPTIEQQIFSATSIKLIKPYNSQKFIKIEPVKYDICNVLKSPSYRKLQNKLVQMMSKFNARKQKLSKQIKNINRMIEEETEKSAELCKKVMTLDRTYDRFQSEYYEIKRENYQLKTILSVRRQSSSIWNINLERQSFSQQPDEIDIDLMSYEEILEMQERLGKHNVGMEANIIAKLKVVQLKDLTSSVTKDTTKQHMNCCICCDEMDQNHQVIQLSCQHIHHADCIREWLKIKRFCPLCKGQVVVM